jgi:hypothetical protein
MQLIKQLYDFIALHATVGAEVAVFHHVDGYIGTVKKVSG